MAVSIPRREPPAVQAADLGASVREVCVVGRWLQPREETAPTVWTTGDHVAWSGRLYRVEANEPAARQRPYAWLTEVSVRDAT